MPTTSGGVHLKDLAQTLTPMAGGLRKPISAQPSKMPGNPMMNAAARFAMKRGVNA